MDGAVTAPREPVYMCEMMRRLGIDPSAGAFGPQALNHLTAFQRCEACPAKQACRAWLDTAPASTVLAPAFCPNAEIFFELHVTQAGSVVPHTDSILAH